VGRSALAVPGRIGTHADIPTPVVDTWSRARRPARPGIGRGKLAGNGVDLVHGAVDDVRLYQSALTGAEVLDIAPGRQSQAVETAAGGAGHALFVNINPDASQWPVNLIGYDALRSYGSPSYYM
jgi:hypothetical protein